MDLVLENVSKSFNGRKVLDNMSISFKEGAISCLMGPSGCGKTTLLGIAAGIMTPDSGSVSGTQGRKMAFAFQSPTLLPWKTVYRNVEFVLPQGMPEKTRQAKVMACLDLVELSEFCCRMPAELSAGMAHRVSLARALAVESDIVFLDEPFSGLDRPLKERITGSLKRLWEETGTTVIMATHCEEDAAAFNASVLRPDWLLP